jgi:hypothetical protein
VDTEHFPKAWATVKRADDYVIVQARIRNGAQDDQIPDGVITWAGGEAVQGKKLQRKVPTASAAKTTVTASIGSRSDHVDVWVVWANVTIQTAGTTPANAVQFGAIRDGTENLGGVRYNGGADGAGKVVAVAKLQPAGVGAVVTSGWMIKRNKWNHIFKDGRKAAADWDGAWMGDDSEGAWLKLIPDSADQIYDTDAPNITQAGAADSVERYSNFVEWVTFGGARASDDAPWYFTAGWKTDQNPKVTWVQVGTGNFTLPGEDGHIYPVVP